MDINGFIEELDSLYTERRINDVEPFFNESIEQAKKENDLAAQFTILNEMMGFSGIQVSLKSLLRRVMIA